jgi:hypothetical protein
MKRIFWVILAITVSAAACSDPVPPTTPTPAVPTINETFSDTLLVGGANTHQFLVTQIGGVKVTLDSVSPSAAVGLGIGFPSLGSCSLLDRMQTVAAGTTVLFSGTANAPGNLCVLIFDIGNLVEPTAYTINVLHS